MSHFGTIEASLTYESDCQEHIARILEIYPDSEEALQAWYEDAERALWSFPANIRSVYPTASFLANNRIVFNIRGNHYRLIAQIHYNTQIVYIRFVDTHAQYDRIDANTV